MRQRAWLYTGPLVTTKTGQERRPARIQQFSAEKIVPAIPPCDAKYLIDLLFEAGPVEPGPHGMVPLSSQELLAWQRGSGIRLAPWEFRLIRRLSADYVAQSLASEDPNEPAPYQTRETIARNRDAVARSIRIGMQAYFLAKKQPQKGKK